MTIRIINLIKKYTPDKKTLLQNRLINNKFGRALLNPRLWRFNNPHTVAGGVALGLFLAFTPTPGIQGVLTTILAIILKVNIPMSILFILTTNVFTDIPLFYFCYRIGLWIFGYEGIPKQIDVKSFHFIYENSKILLAGSMAVGGGLSVIGYFLTYLLMMGLRIIRFKRAQNKRQRKIKI